MLTMKTATASVGADTTQWGELIHMHLINRLSKLAGLVQNIRVLLTDPSGFGLALVTYHGAKAFSVVVVRDWKILPVDTIVYRKNKEFVYDYLCERVILELLTSSSLGEPVGMYGASNANYINMFSPGGGYGARTTNPWSMPNQKMASAFGLTTNQMNILAEAANNIKSTPLLTEYSDTLLDYAMEKLASDSTLKDLALTVGVSGYKQPAQEQPVSDVSILYKTASGSYGLLGPSSDTATTLSKEEVVSIFESVQDPQERFEKTARLEREGYLYMGTPLYSPTTVSFSPVDPTLMQQEKGPTKPQKEGVYFVPHLNEMVYLNPSVVYLDGSPTHSTLAVGVGYHKVLDETKLGSIKGFIDPKVTDVGALGKDQLLSRATSEPAPGTWVVFYDTLTKQVTVPCAVLFNIRDERGTLLMKVAPSLGFAPEEMIRFYNGSERKTTSEGVLMPLLTTIVYEIPEECEELMGCNAATAAPPNTVNVQVSSSDGNLFIIKEDGKYTTRLTSLPLFVHHCVQKYRFSRGQVESLVKQLKNIAHIQFQIPLNRLSMIPKKVEKDEYLREKSAIADLLKVASLLMKSSSYISKAELFESTLAKKFTEVFEDTENRIKQAAAEDTAAPKAVSQYEPVTPEAKEGQPLAEQKPAGAGGLLSQILVKNNPATQTMQELIDQVLYYALGRFRPDTTNELLSKIDDNMHLVSNLLSKLLLLIQLNKVPGISYEDVKILLSDIDSFMNRLISTRVLI